MREEPSRTSPPLSIRPGGAYPRFALDWIERQDEPWMWPIRENYDPLVVFRPRTWLLAEGWKKAGGTLSYCEVPGAPHG